MPRVIGPGCAKCFFFVALRWAPRPFGGARAKKKHHPGCLFFAPAPGKGRGRRSPVGRRHGARAKKKHHAGCFFFAAAPAKGKGRRSPVGSRHGARAKKKNTTQGVFFFAPAPGEGRGRRSPVGRRHGARAKSDFFFALAPCRRPTGLLLPLPFPGPEQKKKHPGWCFFFLLWPRAGAQRGFSFPCLSPGPQQKKKHPGWCFFFCSGPVPAPNGASPSRAFRRGRSKKKNTLGGVFFCCGPARTLTHSLRDWVAMPPPRRGGVFFFAAAPPGPGWCFFLLWPRPDAHSLTVGWGDFGKAWVVFFFCSGPAGSF